MTRCKQILRLLALLLGIVGFVGCMAALAGVWSVGAAVSQTTEHVFERIDGALVVAGRRISEARDGVEAAKITTQSIQSALKKWTKRETGERLAERLELAEKTQRLASGLEQADHWLELSQSSVELVAQALSLGSSAGAPVDAAAVDGLIEEIGSLRAQLATATDFVARLHKQTDDGESFGERIEQAAELALRVIATLGTVDSRLEAFGDAISGTQSDLRELKGKTLRWILIAKAGVALLIVWMAAGQVALGLLAYRALRSANSHARREEPAT